MHQKNKGKMAKKEKYIGFDEATKFFYKDRNRAFLVVKIHNGIYLEVFKTHDIWADDGIITFHNDAGPNVTISFKNHSIVERTSYGMYDSWTDESDIFETYVFELKYTKNLDEACKLIKSVREKLEKMANDIHKSENLLYHELLQRWDR